MGKVFHEEKFFFGDTWGVINACGGGLPFSSCFRGKIMTILIDTIFGWESLRREVESFFQQIEICSVALHTMRGRLLINMKFWEIDYQVQPLELVTSKKWKFDFKIF